MILADLSQCSEKQLRFLRDRHRHVAYGGARGGGKSWAVRTKAKLLCARYKGIKILIVRRSYRELQNNHIEPLRAELHGVARYNGSEKCFRFDNGSTIWFGYCATDSDLGQYQGAEYDVVFIDEAGQLQQSWIEQINACVRGTNGFPKRTYYTLNPGGVSHGYFKRLFIDRRYEGAERPEDYAFTQALVTDNAALMEAQPDYIRTLEALPAKLREAWLYGRWDIFEGQFFEDFRPEPDAQKAAEDGLTVDELRRQHRWCHVIEPFEIPSGWTIWRSYDFGFRKPFSCAWWAVDYDGVIYRILELYGCTSEPNTGVKWAPEEQFQQIRRLELEHPLLAGRTISGGVADPSCWNASMGIPVAETAAKFGVYFSKGDNARLPGWMQMHNRMQFDEHGYTRFYVFDTCKAFIRTIPTLIYSPTHPEDLDTSMEDHVADETRYFCMSRPVPPLLHREAQNIAFDPLEQITTEQNRRVFNWTR